MRKLIISLCTATLAVMTMSVASAQVIPPPMGAQGPPVVTHAPTNNIGASYCEYVWGYSYRCVELYAQDLFDYQTGKYMVSYVELRETVNDGDGPDWEWSFRTVSCNVPRSSLQIARLNSGILPTVLNTDSPECSGYGYSTVCTNFGSECNYDYHYVFTGTHTVETSMGSPDTIEETKSATVRTDFTTGTRTRNSCDGLLASTSRGGFTVDGKYWEFGVVGDPSAPEERGSGGWYLNHCQNKTGP